ncbi:protein CHUP1 chloroplastic-like [Tripterygium wilfordii]|uniref:Protein CHUP1 chloroplastic-like n=1 Tax=Tripterygium wilfordii TaxID=458696 RepID=A0A7J7DY91_TRIWF|nr:protein CHUP1 chloroplastic-like [Tripterygium wilfordii]
MSTRPDYQELIARKEKAAAVLKPPPRPAAFSPSHKEVSETRAPPKPAPPPPPMPSKMLVGSRSLRHVPEVVEMHRSLTGRDAYMENMIGEIENRSTYLSAVSAADVAAFVKWLDEELSSLVDERAVLKHFPQWPERKADAIHEAACNFRDLRNLEVEVSSYEDNLKESSVQALRRMQALQDRQVGEKC